MISQDSRFDCLHRSHWITYGAGEWVTGSGQRRPRDNWKAQHPDFLGSLKAGKEEADARVERSLYSRAVGYSFDSEKIFCNKDGEVTRVPYVVHVPPDVTAQICWLKNRNPAKWRDAWQLEHTLGNYLISDKPMTEEEWAKERATMIDVTPEKDELLPI
jgi:hypothetical protein